MRLRSLRIENLPGIPVTPLTLIKNSRYHRGIRRLHNLELRIATQELCDGSDYDTMYADTMGFFQQFSSTWLQPGSQSLRRLCLGYSDPRNLWGYYPKADFRGIHFPHLENLSLGNFLFSHNWQMEWLSSHGNTLKHLYFDHCPILMFARQAEEMDDEGYPTGVADESDSLRKEVFMYNRKWSDCSQLWQHLSHNYWFSE